MVLDRIPRPRFLRGPALERPFHAPVLRTPRLKLRPHRLDDARAWFELQSNPDILRYLPWPERSREQSRRHLAHRTRRTVLKQQNDFLALAVERDGRLIGDIGLHLRKVEYEDRAVEISWIIDPRHGRRGLASEATAAVLELAFTELHATEVTAKIEESNRRSIALARRLGFERRSHDTYVATRPPQLVALGDEAPDRRHEEQYQRC